MPMKAKDPASGEQVAALYRAKRTPNLVEVPELSFLMIDGNGDPNTSEQYQSAVEALFAVSYGLKFAIKKAGGTDYKVAPLEGLWWSHDMSQFSTDDKSDWQWTMMIRQPSDVSAQQVHDLAVGVAAKKDLPAALDLRLESFPEGRAAQVLHVGPFTAEGPTIASLHAFIDDQGLAMSGKHHEIYLSDIRRADPSKWKTIIRQPVTSR